MKVENTLNSFEKQTPNARKNIWCFYNFKYKTLFSNGVKLIYWSLR